MKDVTKSMIVNAMIRLLSLFVSFVYTPLLLNYLGTEKYGLWSTVLTVVSWINCCDIGIGAGFRNMLTRELSTDEFEKAKRTVSTAYISLSVISFIIYLILLVVVYFVNWGHFFNTSISVENTLRISFAFICINFVLALGNSILYAFQISERVSLINLTVGILNILSILIIREVSDANLNYVAVLYGGTNALVLIWNNINIFRKHSDLLPSFKYFDRLKIKQLCGFGFLFFVCQISGLIMYATDNVLVSHFFGTENVTPFNTVNSVFSAAKSLYVAFIMPIWSRTTMAITKQDITWVKSMTLKLTGILALSIPLLALACLLYKPAAYIWLGQELYYQSGIISMNAVCCFFDMCTITYSQILNGLNCVKFQAVIGILQGVINFPLSIFLGIRANMGVLGIKVATTALLALSAVAYGVYLKIYISKKEINSL